MRTVYKFQCSQKHFKESSKCYSVGNLIKTIPRENRACADKVVSFAKINYHFSKSQMLQQQIFAGVKPSP